MKSILIIHWKYWCWGWNSNTWPAMWKTDSLANPDSGKDWRQEEKETTEDEMAEWHHHWLNGCEFEQALGDGEGQGSLACCSTWGCKETWLSNWTTAAKASIDQWVHATRTSLSHSLIDSRTKKCLMETMTSWYLSGSTSCSEGKVKMLWWAVQCGALNLQTAIPQAVLSDFSVWHPKDTKFLFFWSFECLRLG